MADKKKTTKPKPPPVPAGCVIVDTPAEAPCVLGKIGSKGPGYVPGRAGWHKGKLYCTPDFPMADAARLLRYK